MVARLPTEQEAVGSSPTLGFVFSSFFGSRSSVGRSSASHAEGPGFDPLRELVFLVVFAEGRAFNPPRELSLFFPFFFFCNAHTFLFLFPIWCSR